MTLTLKKKREKEKESHKQNNLIVCSVMTLSDMSACNTVSTLDTGAGGGCARRVLGSTGSTWALCLPVLLLKKPD